jgi:O-antigen/teichoic acid export membrane protein
MNTCPRWLAILPGRIQAGLERHPGLINALSNTGWLFGDRILRMGMGLVVGIWMARYLGPGQFGLFNYAIAFAALFGSIATLGLNGIVVRDLVRDPENANVTLGTTFLLRVLGGLLAFACAIAAISFARPDDIQAKLMVSVLGFVLVFKSTEVVKYWFESQVQSKYTVWLESGVFLVVSATRLALILGQASLMAFVWTSFVEGALVAAGLLGVYARRCGNPRVWRVHYQRAKALLGDSWPLILSGLAVMLYMRIDQIMLGQMLGNESVGIYSAAVQISEVWYFMPMAITASIFPSIIEAKIQSEELYYERLQKLYDLMVILALAVILPMTFLSGWVIDVLYGHDYALSATVLTIHVWAGLIVAISAVNGKWLLTEGLQLYGLFYTVIALIVNVSLNFILIPDYGVKGAAWATVSAQFIPLLAQFMLPKARRNILITIKALAIIFRAARTGIRNI